MVRRIVPEPSGATVRSDAELDLDLDEVVLETRLPRRIQPKTATAIAYMTASFLVGIDQSIVNVALPTFSRAFHAPVASVQWTVIAYVLSLAMWIPALGWIGDRFGTKRTFIFALCLFTFASALCGQARNLPELIAARALQGAGGGMILPVAMTMLWRAYPPAERARVQRLMFIPVLAAPAAGPIIGGALIDSLSWRWIFYVNLPIGIAGLVFSVIYLTEHTERADSRFDLRGFLLSGTGLALVLYAVSEGSRDGWTSPSIVATGGIGVAMITYFIRTEGRTHDPILRIGLLSERLFRATNAVSVLSAGGSLGFVYLAPIFLQVALHRSPLDAGLTTFAVSVGVLVGTQTFGRLYGRVGPRRLSMIGLATSAIITLFVSRIGASTNLWEIRGLMFLGGVTNSTGVLPIQIATFSNIQPADTGHAAAIVNTVRQASTALGVAIVTTIVQSGGGRSTGAFRRGFVAAAAMALAASATAWFFVHDRDARATMVRRRDVADAALSESA